MGALEILKIFKTQSYLITAKVQTIGEKKLFTPHLVGSSHEEPFF